MSEDPLVRRNFSFLLGWHPSVQHLEEADLDDGRRIERPLVFACIPETPAVRPRHKREANTYAYFRPASAFCSSVTAVRIVFPVNGPCEKDIGSPADVAPTANGTC